ncbi:hypothetical protein BYT27DRAFT_6700878 [Phlegmacium glaucopus]|nr:hypothetical protein BYT27DRAFT_6700878 [Phlegmacium glaucopus]
MSKPRRALHLRIRSLSMRGPIFICDVVLGISGFCCPIGTSCFNEGNNNVIQCINALGTTAPAIPSATTGLIPSVTPILGSNAGITYSPASAWNTSTTDFSCTNSKSLHVSDTINATISFNYTGPSIMIYTVTSSNGGVFSVLADGFNTTSTINTFSGFVENQTLPSCYPLQFPPFAATPPGYQSRENHIITLVHIGPSPNAPKGTHTSIVQFDSLAIPDLESILAQTNDYGPNDLQKLNIYLLSVSVISFLYVML